jgi:hypothetical protein
MMTKVEGHFLQQVLGTNPLPMNLAFRSRQSDVTLVDRNGCIKMSIEGPDVIVVKQKGRANKKMRRELRDQEKVANKKMKRELRDQERLTTLNSGSLPKLKGVKESLHIPTTVGPAMALATRQSGWKRSKVKSKGKGKRVNMEKKSVAVVYVYQRDQSKFKKVERDGRDKPIFSIPIGESRVQNNSKRYVVLPISVYYKSTLTH